MLRVSKELYINSNFYLKKFKTVFSLRLSWQAGSVKSMLMSYFTVFTQKSTDT